LREIAVMIVERAIQSGILKRINEKKRKNKVIIIYGARQVGKTTLVKEILKKTDLKSEYFNCDYLDVQSVFSYDNAILFPNVIKDLQLVILDEAQRIPNIGMVLKILNDEFPNLQVIATGSSSFELSNKISEPLTGRKIIYHLYPLSYNEVASGSTLIESTRTLHKALRMGTYPSVYLDEEEALNNLNEIASSYLFKDILAYQNLKRPDVLIDLLKLLAFQISNEVSFTELSGKLKLDQTVVQRYIQLLEENHIIFRLPALKRNLRNEVGKTRKIYFWDLGIRNILIQNLNRLDLRDDVGALWENYCICERYKKLSYSEILKVNSYFWRTYQQKEIDYIEEFGGEYKAYEFKWSERKDTKLPGDFRKAYKNSTFKVVSPGSFIEFING